MKLLICNHHLWRMCLGLWDCPIHYLKEIDKIRAIRKRKNWKVAATSSNRFTWSLPWNSCLFQSIFQRTKMTPQQNVILHYITNCRNTIRKHFHRNLYKGTLHEIPASLNWKTGDQHLLFFHYFAMASVGGLISKYFNGFSFCTSSFSSSKYSAFFMCSCLD